jgi:hypothetical protein
MTDRQSPGVDRIQLLRHTVATLAYRAEKVLREVPHDFAAMRVSERTRTPLEILAHLGDLVEWAGRFARGERQWVAGPMPPTWEEGVARFFQGLEVLDAALGAADPEGYSAEALFQGPIADALTHVGQLALMRGVAGAPVKPESYARAKIEAGRVGAEQSTARTEYDGDASRPRPGG